MNPSRQRNALIALAMVLGIIFANALISFLNVRRLQSSDASVRETYEVIAALQTVLATLVDAETGQRGYLITFQKPFLDPYRAALKRLDERFNVLHNLLGDDAELKAELSELRRLSNERIERLQHSLSVRDQDGFEAAQEVIRQGKGKEVMDKIRKQVGKMEGYERARLRTRASESQTAYWTALTTGAIAALLSIALAISGYRLVVRDIDRRAREAEQLQAANERLEERVRERTAEMKAAVEELRVENETRRAAELEAHAASMELRRSNRELEQFASVASHDLQEPLRKIQAFGDRLNSHARDELGEKGRDYLERILNAAGRMRRLIDDLLAYSRVTTKGQSFRPVDLNAIVQEVLGDLESRLQQTSGKVHLGNLPVVDADPLQMRQLFQNLIANALKFHRPDVPPEVTIQAQVEANGQVIQEGSPEQGLHLSVKVQDNGIGFETEYSDRVFELFQRLHGRDGYEGTGIGLAICKKIVDRHGGTITAHGEPNRGATFMMTLPLAQHHAGENS